MQRGKNLIRKVKNNFMNFFVNKPKAFKFYDQALKYLDQHEIIYAPIGRFKRQIAFAVENVYTQERRHVTLKVSQGKLHAVIKDFVDQNDDYEKQIEQFEQFTAIIHHLKFYDGKK